jgi:ribonuclease J
LPSRVIGTHAPAAAVAAPVAAATPAPVKEPFAATVVVTRDPEPEMPAGRTRRRRSAVA